MNRFHNKYHRHNHHSLPTAGEPDSAHDPIASKDSPFKGEFHVDGQLSATSGGFTNLNVTNDLTVSGNAKFLGTVDIYLPVSTIFEHLTIVPKSTTQNYYFKIDTMFNNLPLMEVYLNNLPIFVIDTLGNVGIGTATPEAKLDVIGDIKCFNLSAINIFGANGLSVGGGSHFNSITAENNSRIGYLEIGYNPPDETYLKTISGNKDLWFYTGDTLNLKMHPNGKNYFPGYVGIGMEPVEPLTLSGQMGFRTNGLVLLDNSYTDTLRIITNRAGDDDQHLFTFTYDGRYIVGDVFHDYYYNCTGAFDQIAFSKINAIDTSGYGSLIGITNVAGDQSSQWDVGANIRLFRVNGDLTDTKPVSSDQILGSIRAYGYAGDTCFGQDYNTGINFHAANEYNANNQGAYTTFYTTCASDANNNLFERVRIDHNGNVGINTNNTFVPTAYTYRNTIRPSWKFTVRDYDYETQPAAVIFAGTAASPMAQIIGGEDILEQTALMLSDRNINDNNTNHIEFTHGSADAKIARVSSLNRGAEGINGGSLLFSTTYKTQNAGTRVSTLSTLPFERARINFDGNMGIGIKTPNSRLHVHDDNKLVNLLAGNQRDVITVSTLNNTNGILLSSVDLESRVYNDSARQELHVTTSTNDGKIKFSTDKERFAAVITQNQNVGIGIDESLDTITRYTGTTIKLGVNGDTMLFNNIGLPGKFTEPAGVSIDSKGNLFVSDADIHTLYAVMSSSTLGPTLSTFLTGEYFYATAIDPVTVVGHDEVWHGRGSTIFCSNSTRTLLPLKTLTGFTNVMGIAVNNATVAVLDAGSKKCKLIDTTTSTVLVNVDIPYVVGGAADEYGGIALDSALNMYVTNTAAHTILKITRFGVVTTLAGEAGLVGNVNSPFGINARFNNPTGVVVEPTTQDLLVADTSNNVIRRVSTIDVVGGPDAGAVTTFATGLNMPLGHMALDPSGNLYVAEYENAVIKKVTSAGVVSTYAPAVPLSPFITPDPGAGAKLFFNKSAASWNQDPLYIHRFNNQLNNSELRVNIGDEFCIPNPPTSIIVDAYAGITGTAGTANGLKAAATFNNPNKVTQDSSGNIYVADTGNNKIRVISPTGTVATFAGSGVAGSTNGLGVTATFNGPRDIVCDSADNLYVIENGSHAIRKITTTGPTAGTVTTLAGNPAVPGIANGTGAAASFNGPKYMVIDSSDIIYLTESPHCVVRRIDTTTAVVTTVAGSGTSAVVDGVGIAASFNNPSGIAIDDLSGVLYVAERTRSIIRKIDIATGTTTTYAGVDGVTGSVDGIASLARFNSPASLCLDGNDLIVVDSATGSGPLRLVDIRTAAVSTVINTSTMRVNSVSRTGTDLIISADNHSLTLIKSLGKPHEHYDNQDVFSVGAYPAATPLVWDRWVDIGACSTVLYNNLSATRDAFFDNNVTIKGALSVINTTGAATKIYGDLYVDGSIYSTADMTAYCGCTPPTGWPWPPPHPPKMSPPLIPSDSRLKLNAVNITDSLEKVCTINGVTFDWDESKQDTHKGRDVGVIAQEIEKILPEIVHERPDGYKGVQYEKIIPLLIECIKDLKKEIDLLKLR